ncbi:hypothetical protein [Rhodopila sp.]|uniref:hypothetical protein n=1 Tax=Rhodopila sp. TaxID=2480087 RepID=UPI003D0A8C1C
MSYDKNQSAAYLQRKADLAARRKRQRSRRSAFDPNMVTAFAARWKAVRAKNGVGRLPRSKAVPAQ